MLVKHTLCLSAYSITVRVSHDVAAVHLHQIRFEPEAGLTGTGTADHQHIFIARRFRVLGAAVHGQALRFRQNHIVLEYRLHIRGNVLMGSPECASVFCIPWP